MCVCCGLDGVGRKGGHWSLRGRRAVLHWCLHCFYPLEPRCVRSSNVVHLDPEALRIQEVALTFPLTWPNNICNTKYLLDPLQQDPVPGFPWKLRLYWKNVTPSCEVSGCPRTVCQRAHTAGAGECVSDLSQHQIVKAHEPLPCWDLRT